MSEIERARERRLEEAVSRALRDNLAPLQRTLEELQQAIADLVAACSSSRPTNALPSMLRAQSAAASLDASLEVLTEFVTKAVRRHEREATEETQPVTVIGVGLPEPAPPETLPPPRVPTPMASGEAHARAAMLEPPAEVLAPPPPSEPPAEAASAAETAYEISEEEMEEAPAASALEEAPVARSAADPGVPEIEEPVIEAPPPAAAPAEETVAEEAVTVEPLAFDIDSLPREERELHRRANRVAKVSMQDIKMLRPREVTQGREHKDLCLRLRKDLDKARRDYDRRFRSILDHPVDYFRYWMVEILAGGDEEALGEYPYPSPVLRR